MRRPIGYLSSSMPLLLRMPPPPPHAAYEFTSSEFTAYEFTTEQLHVPAAPSKSLRTRLTEPPSLAHVTSR